MIINYFFLVCFSILLFMFFYLYYCHLVCCFFFFFKQKTAYEMRISDWSSDVCSSDLKMLFKELIVPSNAHRFLYRLAPMLAIAPALEIGRASCRERVCQYV